MSRDDLDAVAARIQAAWEAGRICPLAGMGMQARIVLASRLLDAGMLSSRDAERVAAEAENVAFAFAPLAVPR